MLGSTLGCGTNPYQNNYCTNIGIQGRPTRVEAIMRLHSNDKLPDLPASVANPVAYYHMARIGVVKSFMAQTLRCSSG